MPAPRKDELVLRGVMGTLEPVHDMPFLIMLLPGGVLGHVLAVVRHFLIFQGRIMQACAGIGSFRIPKVGAGWLHSQLHDEGLEKLGFEIAYYLRRLQSLNLDFSK